jgi:SAM-dependent methyltransferase
MDEKTNRVASLANSATYDAQHTREYIEGAPHVKHASLRRLYAQLLTDVYDRAAEQTECPTALDLGAGEGSATRPLLTLGVRVTAVDHSESQLEALAKKCGAFRDRLELRLEDIDTTLQSIGRKFDIIVTCSFLHHIPDYLGMIRQSIALLKPHGQFFSCQDPMRYDTNGRLARAFSDGAYFSWRVFRGDVWGGLKRRIRRSRGVHLPDSAADNTEYHVTRNGVDQDAIARCCPMPVST